MTDALRAELADVERGRKRDRTLGLAVVLVAFLGCLALSYWAKLASRPEVAAPPSPPTTEGVVGYPSAVDPIATLARARQLTPRPALRGMVLEAVRVDGTIDVGEGPGRARYAFQSAQGHGPQPPRVAGTLPRRHYCGKQNVHLRTEGLVADPDVTDFPCGAVPLDALPDPRCGPREVWAYAVKQGAPKDRMARIEYYRSRAGPAWRFDLPGTPHRFTLYGDCVRVLDGKEAVGSVP